MEYRYKVIAKDGQRLDGYIQAFNERSAREQLLERFGSVLRLERVDPGDPSKVRRVRVKNELIVMFYRRFGTMLDSGISLGESLHYLAESAVESGLDKALDLLTKQVHEGQTLSQAMRSPRLQHIFDPISIGMISVGERTGTLHSVVKRVADLKERQLALTKAFVSALTYPAVLFCVIMSLVVLFSLVLSPGDEGLFAAFGTEMPWPTRVVQGISETLRRPWVLLPIVLPVLLLVAVFNHQLKNDQTFRLRVHSGLLKIPVIGPILQKLEAARLLYFLTDALNVGIPMASALVMSVSVCSNEKTKQELRKVHQEFCDGDDLGQALATKSIFPTVALSMIETGIESGKLDSVMEKVCHVFEEDVRLALDSLTQLAEPVMLIIAGFIAGFFAIATLLPIIKMVETL
jgi:type IV pilus assembly protein PilC